MIIERKINGIEFGINICKPNGLLCDKSIAEEIDNDIDRFIGYLYKAGNEKYTPMVATWELTSSCNFSCHFCYINTTDYPKQHIYSLQELKRYADAFIKKGLLLVYLTGGEVLTIPWFKDFYIYLKQRGVLVCILSNLSLLDMEMTEVFKVYPPMRVTASIYSLCEKRFSGITGSSGDLMYRVLENILLLKQNGINVTCQTPINTMTKEEYLDISRWCYEHDIKHSASDEMRDTYTGISRKDYRIPHDEFVLMQKQTQRANIHYASLEKYSFKYGKKRHFDCKAGRFSFVIGTDMRIRPCFDLYGDCRFQFSAEDNVEKALDSMMEMIQCYTDKYIDGCCGCRYVELCNECIVTQKPHIGKNLQEYMKEQCINRITKYELAFKDLSYEKLNPI